MRKLKKSYWNDPLFVVGIVVNLFFLAQVLFFGWSLMWPTVSGTVVTTRIAEHWFRYGQFGHSLFLTYTYNFDSTLHRNEGFLDTFVSKQLCEASAAKYQGKMIKVYVNPLDHGVSTISPANSFVNAITSSVLVLVLILFLLLILSAGKDAPDIDSSKKIVAD